MHVYGAWIRMIQKGSQRVGAARTGALSGLSCTCMKTTTQSGQAWRGYERAPKRLCKSLAIDVIVNLMMEKVSTYV